MIGSAFSNKIDITIGSPQGAILSTKIFIILAADMELWTNAIISGYADDTTSTTISEDPMKLKACIEDEIYNERQCPLCNEDLTQNDIKLLPKRKRYKNSD